MNLFRFELVPDWRAILFRSHSMRAFWLGVVVLVLPELLFWIFERDIASPRLWYVVGFVLVVYGGVGRVFRQRTVERKRDELIAAGKL